MVWYIDSPLPYLAHFHVSPHQIKAISPNLPFPSGYKLTWPIAQPRNMWRGGGWDEEARGPQALKGAWHSRFGHEPFAMSLTKHLPMS